MTLAVMPATAQCHQPRQGASGSKTVTANLCVLAGAPCHDSCGERLPPLQSFWSKTSTSGIRWFAERSVLVNVKGTAAITSATARGTFDTIAAQKTGSSNERREIRKLKTRPATNPYTAQTTSPIPKRMVRV